MRLRIRAQPSSATTLARLCAGLAALLSAAVLSGCPRSVSPWLHDSGGVDAAPWVDTDEDGLCDVNETALGTRIDDEDSDADGFSDLVEASLSFDPLAPASPDRDRIVILEERPGATARVPVVATVSGIGETFTGAFVASRQLYEDGQSASLFYDSAQAIAAEPMTNVFGIDGESVLAVDGRTNLVFEVRFAFDETPLSCLRAYPFQYVVKRDDGRIVAVQRFTLMIQPVEGGPGEAPWCGARPCW